MTVRVHLGVTSVVVMVQHGYATSRGRWTSVYLAVREASDVRYEIQWAQSLNFGCGQVESLVGIALLHQIQIKHAAHRNHTCSHVSDMSVQASAHNKQHMSSLTFELCVQMW